MSRYWVPGGSGNWNGTDTNNWSDTSGGAPGFSVPTASDDVFFDGNSGAGTATVVTTGALCNNLDFTGFTGTFAGSTVSVTISGSLVLGALMTITYSNQIIFNGASGTKTITSNGKAFVCTVTINTNITLQLLDNLELRRGNFLFNNGSFDANSKDVSIVFTTSSFLLRYPTNPITFFNLSITAAALSGPIEIFSTTSNIVVTNNLVINGLSAARRCQIESSVIGTPRTITAANVSVTGACFRDITGAGAGSWNLSAITDESGDCGGNSGITFTTPQTQYWVGGTGNWNSAAEWGTSSGGSGGRVPLPQDDIIFDANSFSGAAQTVAALGINLGKNIDFTGVLNSPTVNFSTDRMAVFGSITLDPTLTITGTGFPLSLEGRSSFTITSNGVPFSNGMLIEAFGGTYTLQDDLVLGSSLTLSNGTFDDNDFNVTILGLLSSNANTRSLLMGSSLWTITGAGTRWNIGTPTGMTFSAGTSIIKMTDSSASLKTIAHSSVVGNLYDVWFSGTGSGIFNIFSGGTFHDIKSDPALFVRFTAGQTYTVTTFSFVGTPGNLITIDSSVGGSHATLSKSSNSVCSDYLDMVDFHALGGATFKAGSNSVNNGNNTGWQFTSCGGIHGQFFPFLC